MIKPELDTFRQSVAPGTIIPFVQRIFSDQLTPVTAYRTLVAPDERTAPSFLFESVEGGERQGRYTLLGAQPSVEIIAHGTDVTVIDYDQGETKSFEHENPLEVPRAYYGDFKPAENVLGDAFSLPDTFIGGWVGYASYDTVRYLEPEKLPFSTAPHDDRGLPDMHFALYRKVVIFDHVEKVVWVVCNQFIDQERMNDPVLAHQRASEELRDLVAMLERDQHRLPAGSIDLDLRRRDDGGSLAANFSRAGFEQAVDRVKEYIHAGDAFQVVLSQRFERSTLADPFDIYRALRVVNPSPYMIYLQARGSILVASSPEILCRVRDRVVTSRPLAGTRRRGADESDDRALECELLDDEKERAEHIMLVDLARNDLGRVCEIGTINLERIMEIERYSHVMHISSTVTGRLRAGMTSWDALRVSLPVGTVSGAPKVRAMQIIDELEPTRRGPYGGGIGAVGFDGAMDIALTLRTMVVPVDEDSGGSVPGAKARPWKIHLQAGAGIVVDSDPSSEFEETVSKAAALARAIDLAEAAFRH